MFWYKLLKQSKVDPFSVFSWGSVFVPNHTLDQNLEWYIKKEILLSVPMCDIGKLVLYYIHITLHFIWSLTHMYKM